MKIGKRIRILRKKAGFRTQAAFAAAAGVSERTVRGVESCSSTYRFTLYTLKRVLRVLGWTACMSPRGAKLYLEKVIKKPFTLQYFGNRVKVLSLSDNCLYMNLEGERLYGT